MSGVHTTGVSRAWERSFRLQIRARCSQAFPWMAFCAMVLSENRRRHRIFIGPSLSRLIISERTLTQKAFDAIVER